MVERSARAFDHGDFDPPHTGKIELSSRDGAGAPQD
jgi:hypothetical protein